MVPTPQQDCGPWGDGLGNYTETSFYTAGLYDDDDWEFAPDDMFTYGQEMNAQPLYKRDWSDHEVIRKVCRRLRRVSAPDWRCSTFEPIFMSEV